MKMGATVLFESLQSALRLPPGLTSESLNSEQHKLEQVGCCVADLPGLLPIAENLGILVF